MRDNRKRVLIIGGHGGRDPGASHPDGKTREVDITIPAAATLGMILRLMGYDAVMGRSAILAKNERWSPAERARWANNIGGDLLVSIHANACESHSAEGSEVLYYSQKDLAQRMSHAICIEQKRNRGAKERTNLTILKATEMPAILLELGFCDDNDNDDFDDTAWLKLHWPEQMARVAAEIHKYFTKKGAEK